MLRFPADGENDGRFTEKRPFQRAQNNCLVKFTKRSRPENPGAGTFKIQNEAQSPAGKDADRWACANQRFQLPELISCIPLIYKFTLSALN
jgi:hypothetical protein